jgi:two-component system, LuxR family, response regulator FixJ
MTDRFPVYVVDDDDAVRHSLEIMLSSAKFEVRSFESAVEFLSIAATLPMGCLIADVRMPQMDGLELQARIAELRLGFPIVMITGHGDVPIAVRAMRAGAVDFVEKPFSEQSIFHSISLARQKLQGGDQRDEAAVRAAVHLASLTPREREVLE